MQYINFILDFVFIPRIFMHSSPHQKPLFLMGPHCCRLLSLWFFPYLFLFSYILETMSDRKKRISDSDSTLKNTLYTRKKGRFYMPLNLNTNNFEGLCIVLTIKNFISRKVPSCSMHCSVFCPQNAWLVQ